jgi:RNA polymerase sigma factor (sigma-70 family)
MADDAAPKDADLLADVRWLRNLARRLAGGGNDADDLMQDTWMVALRRQRPRNEALRPWLTVAARFLWRRRRRDASRRNAREATVDELAPAGSAESALERLVLLRSLAELVEALPDPYRVTIVMRFFEDRSAAEIGRATGAPAGTVRWRLKEGLDRLRAALDERTQGDRRRWALVALAFRPESARQPVSGGLIMMLTVATAAGVAAALVVPNVVTPEHGSPPRRAGTALAPEPGADGSSRSPRLAIARPAPAASATGAVEGVVLDPSRRPVAGAVVALFPTRETTLATAPVDRERLVVRAVTNADGRFALTELLPGDFVVTASDSRFGPAELSLSVESQRRRQVDLTLTTGGELLSGTTRDAEAGAIGGARITAMQMVATRAVLRFAALSDARGQYAVRLPKGPWHVVASADGYAPGQADLSLPGAAHQDLVLRPAARIAGRVVAGGTGAPVAAAEVQLVSLPMGNRGGGPVVSSNADGYFEFDDATAGRYRITAWSDNRAGRIEVTARADSASAALVVPLEPAATLTGRVVDDGGRPIAAAKLEVFDGALQVHAVRRSQADADGRFRIEGLVPGATFLAAEAPGWAPHRQLIAVGAAERALDFKLLKEAHLLGVILNQEGKPFAGAELTVTVRAGAGQDAPLLAFRRGRTAADGSFRIDGLAPGPFNLYAESSAGERDSWQGILRAGESTRGKLRVHSTPMPDRSAE